MPLKLGRATRENKKLEKRAKSNLMKFNKGEVQSLTAEEEYCQTPVQAEGWPAGKQLCRDGPKGPGGQADHEPAMCTQHTAKAAHSI